MSGEPLRQHGEDAGHPGLGEHQRLVPPEPGDLLALVGRRFGIGIVGSDEVAQVEVGVTPPAVVDVDVGQLGASPSSATAIPVSSVASRRAPSHGVSPGST